MSLELRHEAHFSTQRIETQKNTRLSRAHEHTWRTCGYQCSPCQGPCPSKRLILGRAQRNYGSFCFVSSGLDIEVTPGRTDFSRRQRITEASQYRAVFNNRVRLHGKFFSLHVQCSIYDFHRLGLAVSRKVSKKAVQRNRIKRQIRESFRYLRLCVADQGGWGKIKPAGTDFIVVAKAAAVEAQNTELREELDRLWIKAIRKCEVS